ncbi:hypothetical protein KAU34_08230 [candidate division WOR-3 bacterium]|nr:hypothetical protein [candidate division WOR-3 bacterium]
MKDKQDIGKQLPRSDGDNFKATYENYEVACPICKKWNVFNRITDIGSIGISSGKVVKCLHCRKDIFKNHFIKQRTMTSDLPVGLNLIS